MSTDLDFEDLFDLRLPAYLVSLSGGPDNDLVIVIEEATGLGPEMGPSDKTGRDVDDAFNKILVGSRGIQPGRGDRVVQIRWSHPVAYAVLDESYAGPERTPVEKPRLFSVVQKSWFDDYVSAATWASDDFPGRLMHYSVITLNHVISVLAQHRPEARLITVRG